MEKGAMLVSGSKPLTPMEKLTNALCLFITAGFFAVIVMDYGKTTPTHSGTQAECRANLVCKK
jgi:hypothetical protein